VDDESLNRLIRLRIAVEKTVSDLREKDDSTQKPLNEFALTRDEKKAWLRNEPDFPNRIVTEKFTDHQRDVTFKRPRDKLTPYPKGGRVLCARA